MGEDSLNIAASSQQREDQGKQGSQIVATL